MRASKIDIDDFYKQALIKSGSGNSDSGSVNEGKGET